MKELYRKKAAFVNRLNDALVQMPERPWATYHVVQEGGTTELVQIIYGDSGNVFINVSCNSLSAIGKEIFKELNGDGATGAIRDMERKCYLLNKILEDSNE